MLTQLLSTLGINANEAKVYLSLAELGKSPASVIAKRVHIPRSTAYTALEALFQKGLISIEQAQDVNYYVANQPDAIPRMVAEEKKSFIAELADKESAANEIVPLLAPFFKNKNYSVPKLQFFEGTANVRNMLYDHCREWQRSVANYDYTWWGYQDHEFVEIYRDWLDFYWPTMEEGERILLLSNQSTTERKLKNKVGSRTVKILPKKDQFSSTVWVLGDYVITIMTRQKPYYAFQLQDAVFAANQRLLFQLLWNALP
jgi:sugar-specific transcriptional regulator TrmB